MSSGTVRAGFSCAAGFSADLSSPQPAPKKQPTTIPRTTCSALCLRRATRLLLIVLPVPAGKDGIAGRSLAVAGKQWLSVSFSIVEGSVLLFIRWLLVV